MSKLLDNEFAQTPEEKMRASLDRDASKLRKWLVYTTLSSALLINVFGLLTSPLINTYPWKYILVVYLFSMGILEFALASLMKISLTCIIAIGLGSHLFFKSGFCGPYLSILLTAALYGFLYSVTVSSEYFNPMHEECIKLSQKEDVDDDFI